MYTPEEQQSIARASQHWTERFAKSVDLGQVKLSSFNAPYFLPSLGLCARVELFDAKTYESVGADLVILERSALQQPDPSWSALDARIEALRKSGRRALRRPLAETLGLEEVRPSDELFVDETQARRRAKSLEAMQARFDAVAAKFFEHYGLRLPRWMAVLAALFDSLSELESQGFSYLGRRPAGITKYFRDGALERATIDGLDPRLEWRFRCDPPEMVSILHGDSDGLHYGMFFDDPKELPAGIVHNYARDSAETVFDEARTGIGLLLAEAQGRFDQAEEYGDERPPLSLWAARAALRAFSDADERALREDGEVPNVRARREMLLGGVSAVLPAGAYTNKKKPTLEQREAEYKRKGSKKLAAWLREARDEMAAGKPAFAYTLGRELHWFDSDAHRDEGAALLIGAYEALGRKALAEIARVHLAHRDLPDVSVFVEPPIEGD